MRLDIIIERLPFAFLIYGARMRISDIGLLEQEIVLLSQIRFGSTRHDELRASLAPMADLFESLQKRVAIPEVRLLYFTDPERNPGGRGKSRQQIFESNGTSGTEIYAHPHFIKYIEYFVYGPDLPPSIIAKFKDTMSFSGYLTGGDVNDLVGEARAVVRSARLDPHDAAEEFYKLVLECGAVPSSAESILKSIRAVKYR
jgi:hypothetical protein